MPRKILLSSLVCLLALTVVAEAATDRHLVLIRAGEVQGPALAAADLYLVAAVPTGYLALLDAGEIAALRGSGSDLVVVAPDDPRFEYLVQYDTPPDHRTTVLPDAAEILHRERGYRIVRLAADQENRLSCLADIQRVFRRPLRFAGEAWSEPAVRDVADPVIETIVAAVQQSYLENTVQTLQDFGTRHSEYAGGEQASYWIRDQFLSYGYFDVTLHDYNSWNDNVVCTKPGTAFPDKVVVIGGHYDSTSYDGNSNAPGADDNATGTACVLAAAQAFAPHTFEYTVVFIAFSGEEQGLVGSEAWASLAAGQGLDIVGMVNLDMLGYRAAGDAADIDIVFNTASQPLRDLVDEAAQLYVPSHTVVNGSLPFGASSDHASFWSNGFRAILFFEDSGSYSPYIHTANDIIGTSVNDFAFMTLNVKTALATTAMLARPFTIAIRHDPLAHQDSAGPFPLVAEVVAVGTVDPSSVTLHYRVDGGTWQEVVMNPTGQPGGYAADIPQQPDGALVEYYLTASDTDGHTAAHPDDAPVSLHGFRTGVEYAFVDDAETDLGWTFGVPGDDATTGLWLRADPVGTDYQPEDDHTPDPGHICFVTGNGPIGGTNGAQDVDGGRTTLLSPVFDLSGATWAEIGYWRLYVDETTQDDDFLVDISDDGGTTWQSLEIVGDTEIPWVHAVFELPFGNVELTDQMRLRFIAYDTGGGSLVEALIDDVSVVTLRGTIAVDEPTPKALTALSASPNPFNPQTSLRYALPRAGSVELRIYDTRGREIARPLLENRPAGEGEVLWNARGLPSGLYLARLVLDGEEIMTRKLMLVR